MCDMHADASVGLLQVATFMILGVCSKTRKRSPGNLVSHFYWEQTNKCRKKRPGSIKCVRSVCTATIGVVDRAKRS